MTTQEQRAEWSALAQAATPGEWEIGSMYEDSDSVRSVADNRFVCVVGIDKQEQVDAAFIAAARTAVPALLADVDALQAERDALAAELARVRGDYEYIRQRAPWGAIQRLAWYGAENYNYSTDAKQVEEYVAGFHPNAQQQA